MANDWKVYIREHPRFGGYYRAVESKPSWVLRAAVTCAALVFAVPLILLVAAALLVGVAVFVVLGLAIKLMNTADRMFGRTGDHIDHPAPPPPDPGRENVRVIRE